VLSACFTQKLLIVSSTSSYLRITSWDDKDGFKVTSMTTMAWFSYPIEELPGSDARWPGVIVFS